MRPNRAVGAYDAPQAPIVSAQRLRLRVFGLSLPRCLLDISSKFTSMAIPTEGSDLFNF